MSFPFLSVNAYCAEDCPFLELLMIYKYCLNMLPVIYIQNLERMKTSTGVIRILVLFGFLISACHANGQETFLSRIDSGKFYGIFPVVENHIVYSDTVILNGSADEESLFDRARVFFDRKEDAKYYFESEDKGSGELVYQGELDKSLMSQKPAVHFSLILQFKDSACLFKLFEVVITSPRAQYMPSLGYGTGGHVTAGVVKTDPVETAISLENITIDKGEFSRRYCQKLDKRFATIMEGLRAALL